MIALNQKEIVRLFVNKVEEKGSKKEWVVNEADPTAVVKYKAEFDMMYGFTEEEGFPISEIVSVKIVGSWGYEIEIETSKGAVSAYFDEEWANVQGDFFNVFKRVLLEGEDLEFV